MKKFRLKIPFIKATSYNGKKYPVCFTLLAGTTHMESIFRLTSEKGETRKSTAKAKRIKAGLRKCRGHKLSKTFYYNDDNQCSLCGGYKEVNKP